MLESAALPSAGADRLDTSETAKPELPGADGQAGWGPGPRGWPYWAVHGRTSYRRSFRPTGGSIVFRWRPQVLIDRRGRTRALHSKPHAHHPVLDEHGVRHSATSRGLAGVQEGEFANVTRRTGGMLSGGRRQVRRHDRDGAGPVRDAVVVLADGTKVYLGPSSARRRRDRNKNGLASTVGTYAYAEPCIASCRPKARGCWNRAFRASVRSDSPTSEKPPTSRSSLPAIDSGGRPARLS